MVIFYSYVSLPIKTMGKTGDGGYPMFQALHSAATWQNWEM